MKKVKLFTLVLTLVFCVSSFVGCSGNKEVRTGDSYTYWVSLTSNSAQTLSSFNDLLMYKELSRVTGVDVEFLHPSAGSTGTEAFQVMLASGNYPDMIEYSWQRYAGGAGQAIEDGVIIALDEYMEDYAPNYYDYMEGEKGKEKGYLYKAQSTTADGNYYGFKNMNIGTARNFNGLYVRRDLLEKWGLDVPVTIDDWTEFFTVAKENGIKYPLTGVLDMFAPFGYETFNSAYGVGKGFYVENGKVKFGPFEKKYKEYIKQATDWAAKGFIDPDYVTNKTIDVEGAITSGSSVATYGAIGGGLGKIIPAMLERDPNFKLVACPYPVLKEGDVPFIRVVAPEANDPTIAITVNCGADNEDRYKEAISWCDYLYSEEGMLLKSFGVEGVTYTKETDENGDVHYVYTDDIYDETKWEEIGAHSVDAALWHFFRPANSPGLNQHPDYLKGYYPYEEQKEAMVTWNKDIEFSVPHVIPPVLFTDEEATRKAQIESVGQEELNAAISNVVLGRVEFSKYETAIKAAKKAGYDELLNIYQAAYDRYLKNLK